MFYSFLKERDIESLAKLRLTQHQFIDAVELYKESEEKWLHPDWFTFCLLAKEDKKIESEDDLFVASVGFDDGGRLSAYVYRFGNVNVWSADDGHLVLLPHTAVTQVS